MEIKLAVAVVHAAFDSDRRVMLLNLLRTMPDRVTETVHFEVVKDHAKVGAWVVTRKAMMLAGRGGSTHLLIIQDDTICCKDFLPGLKAALRAKPDVPVAVYANRRVMEDAVKAGSSWARIGGGCWGQAFVYPTDMIREFLAWERVAIRPGFRPYDSRVSMWLIEKRIPAWATCPSLVQHIAPSVSLLGYANKHRVARVFTGESALEIDWSKGLEKPPVENCTLSQYAKFLVPLKERHG